MATTVLTIEDLQQFKSELFAELKQLHGTPPPVIPKWLKSYQVIEMLGISRGTLHTMSQNGTLVPARLGGLCLYDQNDINQLMQKNKRKPHK